MLPHDLCSSNCTGAQIALGTGLHLFQLIPIHTSAEFESHSSALSTLALTRHHTHIHTQTYVNYHFYIDPTAGFLTPQSSSFRSKLHFCQTQAPHNQFGSNHIQTLSATSPHSHKRPVSFSSISDRWFLCSTVSQCVKLELLLVLISLVSYHCQTLPTVSLHVPARFS